jgi:cell division protein FtsB
MIEVNLIALLVMLQLLVVVAVLAAFSWWQSRRRQQQIAALNARIHEQDRKPSVAIVTPTSYLNEELTQTKAQLAGLTDDPAHEAFRAVLKLRRGYLTLEHLWSRREHQRDHDFWPNLQGELSKLAGELGIRLVTEGAMAGEASDVNVDEIDITGIISKQQQTIHSLKEYIASLDQDGTKAKELEENIDGLIRTNRELADCVHVLEDENKFLREQVGLLVSMDGE